MKSVSQVFLPHALPCASSHSSPSMSFFSPVAVTRKTLSLAISIGLIFGSTPYSMASHAQVVADPNTSAQHRPDITSPPNSHNVPVVNIATPNGAGISHNQYQHFNVDQQGLILNNGVANSNTHLGGWIQGNPNLAGGQARIILNEVTSGNPSMLRGYIEVGGGRAEVIIANPAGISVNGGGFINASGVTLTTGTPQFNYTGNLEAFRVAGGNILINGEPGKGLDTAGADYTRIISRAAQINSGIWANDLTLTAGVGVIAPNGNPIEITIADEQGKPLYAIDVAQLGGMYAGKIRLIGTEAGVGVRNAGHIGAQAGQVHITADGRLINSGTINSNNDTNTNTNNNASTAPGNIQLSATEVTNSGTLYAQGGLQVTASGQLANTGTMAAQGNVNIAAQNIHNQTNSDGVAGLIAAGMNTDGSFNVVGNLVLQSSQTIQNQGQLLSGGDGSLMAQEIVNTMGLIRSGNNLTLNAQTLVNQEGELLSAGSITLQTSTLHNQQGLISAAKNIQITGKSVYAPTPAPIATTTLNNQDGIIIAGETLGITVTNLHNADGQILAQEDLNLRVKGSYTQELGSQIIADKSLNLTVDGTLTNQGSLLAGETLTLVATQLDNQATGEISAGKTQVTATNIINRGVIDGWQTYIKADNLLNIGTGRIYGTHLGLEAQNITNTDETIGAQTTSATIAARERLDIGTHTLKNQNGAIILSLGDMHISGTLDDNHMAQGQATLVQNDGATIETMGNMQINAVDIQNLNTAFISEEKTTTLGHTSTIITYTNKRYDLSQVRILYAGKNYRYSGTNLAELKQMLGGSDKGQLILPSEIYPFDKFGPDAGIYDVPPKAAYIPAHDESLGGDNGDVWVPENYAIEHDSYLWNLFGVPIAQDAPAPPAVDCSGFGGGGCTINQQQIYNAYTQDLAAWKELHKPSYLALNTALTAFHQDLNSRLVKEFMMEDYDTIQHTEVVLNSRPGQIVAGGHMVLNGNVVNDKSRIQAGGDLITTGHVTTIDAKGEAFLEYRGESLQSFIKDHVIANSERRWRSDELQRTDGATQISLAVSTTQGNTTVTGSGTQVGDLTVGGVGSDGSIDPGTVISTTRPSLTLPEGSLYTVNPGSDKNYLIETDPRFASYGKWLTSDHMLSALGLDPSIAKRLGDGYYEQQLIREQIGKLTGYRFLAGYNSDDEQYKALMNAGVEFAQEHQLSVGIALTPEQMKHLTSDIVWLVSTDVTLPNGTVETVLVPQVYTRSGANMITADGALMSASNVYIGGRQGDASNKPTLINNATIAAREGLFVDTAYLQNLTGQLHGNNVVLQSTTDIDNLGGVISADSNMTLLAGRDINITSTVVQGTDVSGHTSNIGNTGVVYLSGKGQTSKPPIIQTASPDNTLAEPGIAPQEGTPNTASSAPSGNIHIQAGRDINVQAAYIGNDAKPAVIPQTKLNEPGEAQNETQSTDAPGTTATANTVKNNTGTTTLIAGNNLSLSTVTTGESHEAIFTTRNWAKGQSSTETGSRIITQGDVNLVAGNALHARAATLDSNQGSINASANSITLEAGEQSRSDTFARHKTESGLFGSTSTTNIDSYSSAGLMGTTLSAEQINLQSTKDLNIAASDIVATKDVNLVSKEGNINITAGTSNTYEYHYERIEESGLLAGGADNSFTFGNSRTTTVDTHDKTYNQGSTIGSLEGNVNISAQGGTYNQMGSDVLALKGDINIVAQDISITEGRETERQEQTYEYKQNGFSVGISSAILSAMQQFDRMEEAADKTDNTRMKQLALGAALLGGFNAIDLGKQAAQNPTNEGAGGIMSIDLSLGSSKTESHSLEETNTAKGSTLIAGGNINLVASGKKNEESNVANGKATGGNITIQGSTVSAGNNVALIANDQINILAAANTRDTQNSSKSSSSSVGASYSFGQGWSFNASTSKSKANGAQQETTWTASQIKAGNTTTLISGGDTNIIGSQVIGNRVQANIGGDLNIQSLQDTTYAHSSSQSSSASISGSKTGFGGKSSGMGINANKTNASATGSYQSVNEYAGIMAGDGGFDITVQGNTDLKGAIIASTQNAVDNNKNSLTTGSLTLSDITNSSTTQSEGSTSGMGLSFTQGNKMPGFSPPVVLKGEDNTRETSLTLSGISGGKVTITNEQAQQDKTGQTAEEAIEGINTAVLTGQDTAGLNKNWDTQQLVDQMNANLEIAQALKTETASFLAQRAKEADDARADAKNKLNDPSLNLSPQERADLQAIANGTTIWDTGGIGRLTLTALTAALSGNVSGSSADLLQGATINVLQGLGANQIKNLVDNHLDENDAARAALQGILACGGAAAQGASCGSGALGASAGVILNHLIDSVTGENAQNLTAQEKIDRINLINTLIGSISEAAGGDTATAIAAAKIEMENNSLSYAEVAEFAPHMLECEAQGNCAEIRDYLAKLSEDNFDRYMDVCVNNFDPKICGNEFGDKLSLQNMEDLRVLTDYIQGSLSWWEDGGIGSLLGRNNLLYQKEKDEIFEAMEVAAGRKPATLEEMTPEQLAQMMLVAAVGGGSKSPGKAPTPGQGSNKNPSTGNKPPNTTGGGSSIPVPNAVVSSNGLTYKSNPKHTPGEVGNRPNAGLEPKSSLTLFNSSIVGSDGNRYAKDSSGNLHRFAAPSEGTGAWHWNGSTGQGVNSLRSPQVPVEIRRSLNMPSKGW